MIEHIGVWKSLHYPVKGIEVYSLVMPPKNWVQKKGLDIPSFFCWAIEQRIPELNRSQLIGPIWNPPPVEHLSDNFTYLLMAVPYPLNPKPQTTF